MIKKILALSTGLILGIVGASLFWMNKDYFESLAMNHNAMSMKTDKSESSSAEKNRFIGLRQWMQTTVETSPVNPRWVWI